ncbi:MAG: hypothetical protein HZA51_06495 [Planctomycetes bacterium]|nr:hypothetical protein [Planctomycetota bacterium]
MRLTLGIVVLAIAGVAQLQADDAVELTFIVAGPKGMAEAEVIHVSGNVDSLGAWAADGLQLQRQGDGRFAGTFSVPTGTRVEFKFTLGSWEGVEKTAAGGDVPNRTLTALASGTHEFTVARWGNQPQKSSIVGGVRYHQKFASKILKNERTLIVYLPPGYDAGKGGANESRAAAGRESNGGLSTTRPTKGEAREKGGLRYPVLYMHDGQNLFDAGSSFIGVEWQVDETVERLIKEGKIPPIIVVGIYNNAERMNEYTPTRDAERKAGGHGEKYARFVIEEVKPFIDKTYRTRPGREDTAVAGSSLGGLISLYMGVEHGDVFSKCGVISPALMWDESSLLNKIATKPEVLKGLRIWLDMGTKEGSSLESFKRATDHTQRLVKIMKKGGLREGVDFKYMEVEGAVHNEGAWAERFDRVLVFLYGEGK